MQKAACVAFAVRRMAGRSAALAFTRQTDELFTIFKNLQTLGKDVPLRLNWFVLEYCCEDLFKITNRILFMTRDMEKHYE